MSDRLSFSLDNFKTTSESSDFSASLLSSLDLDFDKFDLTLKNDDTTLTNSPVLPTEKKTSPIHKPSLQRKPVHRSSLLSEPEITSADLTSSPALHNADAILQHFESFASSPRSRLSSPPLDLKLDAPQSPTILPPRSNSVSLGNEHISKPEMSKMLSTGDFEKMLTTAGTKHLSSTPDIMNSLDIPPDQFEFSMPSRRSSLIDGVKAQGFKIFGKLGAKKPRPSSGLVVSNTSFSLDSSNAPPALPPRNSKSKLSEQTNSEEDLARPSSPFIRPSSPVNQSNQPNSPIPRSDPIQRAKSPFSFVEGSDHLEKLAAELMPPEVAQVNSILPAEISRPVSPGLESARPSSVLSSKLSVSSGKPESTTVKSPNGEKTVQTMLEFLLTESEGPTSPRSPMSPSLPRKTDSATPVNPLARLIPEPNIIAKQLPGAEGWHDMVPDLNPKPKMESIEIQTDEFECEKCNEPKPTFEEKGTETDLVLEEAEKASVLEEENVRLRQELQAMKLMVQTARSQTQQMKILKEAAEARFEQLARVAHRKLVRAMVDLSEASAKVGNFPFTTIKPNHGVAYVNLPCPCAKFNKQAECNPRQGKCVNGVRAVPLQILDVAGLVPGASTGAGLGNQFLDDLRTADALIHVVDASGTTDENGKVTVGYDPINDIDWLRSEIHSWVYNNLMKKWPNIVRRHVATKSPIVETLQGQFSGYGTNRLIMNQILDKFPNKDPLETWSEEVVQQLVDVFLDVRFPTVVALNKIDLPDSDKNIDNISRKYDQSKIVLISALAENFLRKLHKQKFINYYEGTDAFETAEDVPVRADGEKLIPMDDKTKARLERVQDLVLFRFGHTGIQECLKTVVDALGLIPVYPVRNVNNFSSSTGTRQGGVFRDCMLIRPGITVRQLAGMVHPDLEKYYLYAETVGNIRLGEDDLVSLNNNIISFKTSQEISKPKLTNK